MPNGIDGQELLRRARALRPGLKALFTSGYSEQFLKDKGATQEGVALLNKPYRTQSLAEAVRGSGRVTYIFGRSSAGLPAGNPVAAGLIAHAGMLHGYGVRGPAGLGAGFFSSGCRDGRSLTSAPCGSRRNSGASWWRLPPSS